MIQLRWSRSEARLFQLYAVGLHGKHYPSGKAGIEACFADLDVLQLDALPLMGRNHDLVIQTRVDGTHPDQVLDLIHQKRLGFEYWDKAFCAIPLKHFPVMRAFMGKQDEQWNRQRQALLKQRAPDALEAVYEAVKTQGPISSRELKDYGTAPQHNSGWKSPKVASIALELLWDRGQISTTHRINFRKYFDLTERVIPNRILEIPADSLEAMLSYWLKKRVCNVGLLPLRGDAESWAVVRAAKTRGLVEQLLDQAQLMQVSVEGVEVPFLAPAQAQEILEEAKKYSLSRRVRFIAPLDQLIWSRQTLAKLWDFEYVWEVYKPQKKRRWGYYVLPVLYRDRFVARFDGKFDRTTGTLNVLAYHQEPGGLPYTHTAVAAAFRRFTKYLGAERLVLKC